LHTTDVGPVIDAKAKQTLLEHIDHMTKTQKKVAELSLGEDCQHGDFVAPTAFEIADISCLTEEKFGPVLHIVRFKASELADVVNQINRPKAGGPHYLYRFSQVQYR